MNPEQKLAELLAIVDALTLRNGQQEKLIQLLLTQRSELTAQVEALSTITKAMK